MKTYLYEDVAASVYPGEPWKLSNAVNHDLIRFETREFVNLSDLVSGTVQRNVADFLEHDMGEKIHPALHPFAEGFTTAEETAKALKSAGAKERMTVDEAAAFVPRSWLHRPRMRIAGQPGNVNVCGNSPSVVRVQSERYCSEESVDALRAQIETGSLSKSVTPVAVLRAAYAL